MEVEKIEKLDKKEQHRLKIFSKIIYILAKIGEIFCYVGVSALVVVMFIVPFITSNIKYTDGEIIAFEQKITYEKEDDKYTVFVGEKEYKLEKSEEVMAMDTAISVLEKDLLNKYVSLVEVILAAAIICVILGARELRYVNKIFKNVHNEDTPFISENVNFIKKIAYLIIAAFVVNIVRDLILEVIYMNDAFYNDTLQSYVSGSSIDIFKLLAILCLYYIAKYGVVLQNNSKKKIYD